MACARRWFRLRYMPSGGLPFAAQAGRNSLKGDETLDLRWVVLAVVAGVYLYLCITPHHRAKAVWLGIAALAAAGYVYGDERLMLRTIATDAVIWNVLGVLAGAMVIADLFMDSRAPARLADVIADKARTAHMAMLGVCALSGAISAFVDNVTTVLLVAPVALAIVKRTGADPVPLFIGIAIMSNLEGAATLVGDPPSMMLAGFFRLGFNDFFFHQSRPFVFFAIQAGAVSGLIFLWLLFRRHSRKMEPVPLVKVKSWVPVGFIVAMVAFLATSSSFDPGFRWLAGTGNVILGCIALAWAFLRDPAGARDTVKRYEYPTIFFLAGIFVLAYAMNEFGWVQTIGDGISSLVGQRPFVAFTVIVWFSVLVSAFVDNIAYVAVMLPVTKVLAEGVGGSPMLYAGGLLVGACLGGNITPIGASCNVVACGLLRREGHPVGFWRFAKIGLPFTVAATLAGYIFTWIFWRTAR